MNEPQPGIGQINPIDFGHTLFAFYSRVIQAVSGVRDGLPTCNTTGQPPPPPGVAATCAYPDLGVRDTRHLWFTEPTALRNELDFAPEEATPFTSYPGVRCPAGRGARARVHARARVGVFVLLVCASHGVNE